MFQTIGIIGRRDDTRAASSVAELARHLSAKGLRLLVEADPGQAPDNLDADGVEFGSRVDLARKCDLVVVLAGDGTILGAARSLVEHDVPLVGVNLGRLGFLTDISPGEMVQRLDEILAGAFKEERRFLLEARIERPDESGQGPSLLALNEVVAHKLNIARLVQLETYVDGSLVSRQRSDGLVIATPTGSTAYALSGGGPIIHPSLEAVVLVPIAPHTLSSRPLVVAASSSIEIRVKTEHEAEAQLTCDGQDGFELAPGDRVHIRRHPQELRLIHPTGYDYFDTLRAKLYWGRET